MWNKTPLRSFLRRQKKSIALQLGCLALFALVFFLYRMPMDALLYALSLCAVLLALAPVWKPRLSLFPNRMTLWRQTIRPFSKKSAPIARY